MTKRIEMFINENKIDVSDLKNPDIKLDFIQDVFLDTGANQLVNTIRKFNQFGRIENKLGKDLKDFSSSNMKNDFIEFFSSFIWNYDTFNTIKSLIKSYYDWLKDRKIIGGETIRELEKINYDMLSHRKMYTAYYFRTFNELRDSIDKIKADKQNKIVKRTKETKRGLDDIAMLKDKVEDRFKYDDMMLNFHMAEIVMYLAWCGIDYKNICNIKKEDIDAERALISIKGEDESIIRYIRIDENPFLFNSIIEYKNSNEYVPSDYLIRSAAKPQLKANYLIVFLSRYFGDNEYNDNDHKILNYTKVYWSGIYSRARLNRITYGEFIPKDTERLSKVFKEDYTKSNSSVAITKRLISFNEYMKYLFPSEIIGYQG